MISKILNLLSAEISIEVSPDRFVFKRKNEIQSLKTKIYLSEDSRRPIVLGIGDDFSPIQPNKCITLFEETSDMSLPNLGKAECLDAYFRHAFRLITKRTIMVRPKVVFKNSSSLKNILCGYQSSILKSAAVNAGARECVFE